MTESRKTIIIVVAAVAALLAIYSGWRTLGGSRAPSEKERMTTTSGPISRMSSMLGPDASGKPRTQLPSGGAPAAPEQPR